MKTTTENQKNTIYFLQGDLAKDVQVGAVQGPAEHPVNPGVVGVQEGLGGDAVRNEPDAQEEEEEEDIFHLRETHTHTHSHSPVGLLLRGLRSPTTLISGGVFNYHSLHDDNLRAQLFVDGEDVNETQRENHEVYRQHRPARLVGVVCHPARTRVRSFSSSYL